MEAPRQLRRGVALVALLVASALLPTHPASAGVALSASLTMPGPDLVVGQVGLEGSFTVVNTNSAPEHGVSNTLTQVRLVPSCGGPDAVDDPCPTPDPDVLVPSWMAAGRAGTACAGVTFYSSLSDGVTTYRPGSPVVLGPPGGTIGSDRCTVDFTLYVSRTPTIDVDPGLPGTQTNAHILTQATAGALTVTAQQSRQVTVGRATPVLRGQATFPSARVGEVLSDSARVLGHGQAMSPTGTVTFRAFGPDDATCSGAVFGQSTNALDSGTATATSDGFVVTETGVYRWVASYSGDANYHPAGPTACGDPAQTVPVRSDLVTPLDFDTDRRTDIAVFRPSNGIWYIHRSSGGDSAGAYGGPGDVPVAADYAQDGTADIAVFRPSTGVWYIHATTGGDAAMGYGDPGDVPVPGDYDGDGRGDIAVFRPSNGGWYVHRSSGGDTALRYGGAGDVPVPGDYDTDGMTDIAVFRPSTSVWYIHLSSGGDVGLGYGASGDVPVAGDYDGDGRIDIAVFRPSNGGWYVHQSSGGDTALRYGGSDDMPVAGDYDNDGKADLAVFRLSTGVWYIHQSSGGDVGGAYGGPGDIPPHLPASIRTAYFSSGAMP